MRISAALIAKKTGKPPRETDCPPKSMLLLTPLLLSTGLVVPHQASTASVARVPSARLGMADDTWTGRVLARLGSVAGMKGRERLKEIVQALGFPIH